MLLLTIIKITAASIFICIIVSLIIFKLRVARKLIKMRIDIIELESKYNGEEQNLDAMKRECEKCIADGRQTKQCEKGTIEDMMHSMQLSIDSLIQKYNGLVNARSTKIVCYLTNVELKAIKRGM